AWTRMIDSIPTDTPEQKKRVDTLKTLDADKIAPFVIALCSDGGAKVTGQIFGVRNNQIFLFSQPRPIRTAHAAEGWTPEAVAEQVFDEFADDFYPLHRSADVFTWDPV
ncbi:MAG: 3-hydroxyacyl-CoA dehydrogenase, partial [Novosphingobium sp.]|nr:3-hydroxyacyl-CoA dehydrogenase [Novosphingobium sp.]